MDLEYKSDVFRDPPPWSVSPLSTRPMQNGTLHTPVAQSNGQPKMFKTKQIDPSEYGPRPWSPPSTLEVPAEPVLPKQGNSPAVMREVVWRPVSRGPPAASAEQAEQHLYCELEQKEGRPVSQASMASSFRMQGHQQASHFPEVDVTRCQSASDAWTASTKVVLDDERGGSYVHGRTDSYLIFVIFSPPIQFLAQFFSTQKRVNRDKTDYAKNSVNCHKTDFTTKNRVNFRFLNICHV